jgi:histidinol-phosphate aminotransferase
MKDSTIRRLPRSFTAYEWAMSTSEVARIATTDPRRVLRFDGNVPPDTPEYARSETIAAALEEIHRYPHGGFPALLDAIAEYSDVDSSQVVLGAGADDLILLVARSFAGPGDAVRVLDEPTYPLFRIATGLAGADVVNDDAVVTFLCRPHNPTGALQPIPDYRPLVVDEAYFEYCGDTAVGLIGDRVVVIRTFSKAFGLAGARIGYALADVETARELRVRQDPLPVTSLSAALALAALRDPPDIRPQLEERERFAAKLRELGYDPLPSHANFLYVPMEYAHEMYEQLLSRALVVRPFKDAIRITVNTPSANERLLDALTSADTSRRHHAESRASHIGLS